MKIASIRLSPGFLLSSSWWGVFIWCIAFNTILVVCVLNHFVTYFYFSRDLYKNAHLFFLLNNRFVFFCYSARHCIIDLVVKGYWTDLLSLIRNDIIYGICVRDKIWCLNGIVFVVVKNNLKFLLRLNEVFIFSFSICAKCLCGWLILCWCHCDNFS